jgi:hypothetical protein
LAAHGCGSSLRATGEGCVRVGVYVGG